jgi:hypothetical protein
MVISLILLSGLKLIEKRVLRWQTASGVTDVDTSSVTVEAEATV